MCLYNGILLKRMLYLNEFTWFRLFNWYLPFGYVRYVCTLDLIAFRWNFNIHYPLSTIINQENAYIVSRRTCEKGAWQIKGHELISFENRMDKNWLKSSIWSPETKKLINMKKILVCRSRRRFHAALYFLPSFYHL